MAISGAAGGRANSFDLLRLAAAVLVILHHTRPLQGLAPYRLGATDLGELGVGTFFVISGYLVTASHVRSAGIRDFLLRRLLRIEPGLVVSLLLTALVLGAFETTLPLRAYFGAPQVYLFVLRDALLYPVTYALPGVFQHTPYPGAVNGSLWTLRLEFTCYLGLAALGALRALRPWVLAGLAALALAAFAMLRARHPELPAGGALKIAILGAQYGFLFLAGALLQAWGRPAPRWALLSAGFLATPLWILGLPVLVIALGETKSVRPPADLSYGLYIYAFPIQQALAQAGVLNPLLAVAATLPLAIASWLLVEKPALRLKPRAGNALEPSSVGLGAEPQPA